jgi:ribosome-associated translation inhibitor RaiA
MNRTVTDIIPEVSVETRGAVPADVKGYAREKVWALSRFAPEPILFSRVRLTYAAHAAVSRPAFAQATIDVNGRPVHAHAAGASMPEAIDLLQAKLRARLTRLPRHGQRRHHAKVELRPLPRGVSSPLE